MRHPTKFRFTQRAIDQLPAHDSNSRSKCAEYTDTQVPGLKCQVTKMGRKSWYYRCTVRGVKRAKMIGRVPSTTLEEARAKALEYQSAIDRGLNPFEGEDRLNAMPTFEVFARHEYLPYVEQYKRSADDDEAKLRIYAIPAFGGHRLCDVTTRDIQMYLGNLIQQDGLSKATANRHLALFSKLFKLAVKWQRIDKNPCLGIDKYREDAKQERFLSADETRRVIIAAEQDINRYAGAAIQLLLLTGCRREEILQLEHRYVDLEQGTLYLHKTKNGRSRYVILNDAARQLLADLPKVKNSPWVFPGRDPKKPLNNPRKAFLRILKAADVKPCRIHDLRHSHASLLVNEGASLYQVQQILGHASPQTTQRYSHLASQTLRDVSQIVGRIARPTK